MHSCTSHLGSFSALVLAVAGNSVLVAGPISVTTYHYNNLRTGWNAGEVTLSAMAFPTTFGVLRNTSLDDQVDAQPLLVPAENIAGGKHDVVYVVTESNSVYAIDANTGAVLVYRKLGLPVPTPLGCANSAPSVGIKSTPVIDLVRGEMFVMSYVNGVPPRYRLHALNLTTLADQVPPVTVAASQKLTDGSTFRFNATYQMQRPGLVAMGGNVYAGFGSFCDFAGNKSRGWVLGWYEGTLARLTHAELNDSQATSPTSFFLSSVWMSGFGLAAANNTIFFSTGNSDCNLHTKPEECPSQSTYDGVTNIQESVVGIDQTLSVRKGVFTPSNVFAMDVADADLGAGGVMLMPKASGGATLAAIVAKDGRLWLLNYGSLATSLDMHQLSSGCWCGPSYFQGSDGINRLVTSTGNTLQTWQVLTSPAPHLVSEATGSVQSSAQDPGFFTVVSSNGGLAGSAIIWAVARPTATAPLTLYAFDARPVNGRLVQLYSSPAGQWMNMGANANIVPVVANGKVYVASYKRLMIFGPNGSPAPASASVRTSESVPLPVGITWRVSGTLLSINGPKVSLLTRTGQIVRIDESAAAANQRSAILTVGNPYTVLGDSAAETKERKAIAITRAKTSESSWPEDR
jgi:outer membrane protein assembly factor BamB